MYCARCFSRVTVRADVRQPGIVYAPADSLHAGSVSLSRSNVPLASRRRGCAREIAVAGARSGASASPSCSAERGFRTLVDGEQGLRPARALRDRSGTGCFTWALLAMLVVGAFSGAGSGSAFRGRGGALVRASPSRCTSRRSSSSTSEPVERRAFRSAFPGAGDRGRHGRNLRRAASRRSIVHTRGRNGRAFGVNRPFRQAPYQVMVHSFGYMAGWVDRDRSASGWSTAPG